MGSRYVNDARNTPAMVATTAAITHDPVKTRLTLMPIKKAVLVSSAVARILIPAWLYLKKSRKTTSSRAVAPMVYISA
jgi:hypothetical protein